MLKCTDSFTFYPKVEDTYIMKNCTIARSKVNMEYLWRKGGTKPTKGIATKLASSKTVLLNGVAEVICEEYNSYIRLNFHLLTLSICQLIRKLNKMTL